MQQRKNVIFIADSLDNAHKFQAVLSSLDAVSYTHLDVYKRQTAC